MEGRNSRAAQGWADKRKAQLERAARLKAELGRADGGSANVLGVEGGEVPDQKPRSQIKRFIAKLSPKKKTRAERDGALMGAH